MTLQTSLLLKFLTYETILSADPLAPLFHTPETGMTSLQVGAGTSLDRPGRKQATVTKFGIYSTYSP